MSEKFLIGYRDEDGRIKYYLGVDGKRGKTVCGPKKEAPRVEEDVARVILRQLPSLDARDWQAVEDAVRCKFS